MIWCHKVILNKTFEYLENLEQNSNPKPEYLFRLLFDILFLFSTKEKMLKPLRNDNKVSFP
jgi:hypothetical protein